MIVEKHSRLPRKFRPNASKPSQRLTSPGKAVSIEVRGVVLDDAKEMILQGFTIAQIAIKHSLSERTIEYWLASIGDEYKELRSLWIDSLLAEAGELLKDTSEAGNAPLRLARARELWKRATWYAERRDPARYGQEQVASVVITPVLNIMVSGHTPQDVVGVTVDPA